MEDQTTDVGNKVSNTESLLFLLCGSGGGKLSGLEFVLFLVLTPKSEANV